MVFSNQHIPLSLDRHSETILAAHTQGGVMLISCPLTSDYTHTHSYCTVFVHAHTQKHHILALNTYSFFSVLNQLSQSVFKPRAFQRLSSHCQPHSWCACANPCLLYLPDTSTDSLLSALMTDGAPSIFPSLPLLPSRHQLGTRTGLGVTLSPTTITAPVHYNQVAADCLACMSAYVCFPVYKQVCSMPERWRNKDCNKLLCLNFSLVCEPRHELQAECSPSPFFFLPCTEGMTKHSTLSHTLPFSLKLFNFVLLAFSLQMLFTFTLLLIIWVLWNLQIVSEGWLKKKKKRSLIFNPFWQAHTQS